MLIFLSQVDGVRKPSDIDVKVTYNSAKIMATNLTFQHQFRGMVFQGRRS